MPRSIYIKLTGRRRTLGGYTQLWLAPDHILLLTSSRFNEDYKRFSISDIQSIVVTQLPPRLVLQVVMILAALAWISLRFVVDSTFAKWFFGFTGVFALLWPLIDIARGPHCRSFLHTRVSRELLEPVDRMNTARRFLATVRPMIEAAQGVLAPQDVTAVEIPSPAPETAPPGIVSAPGYVPEIVFGLFIVNAAFIWASVRFPKAQEISGVLLNTLFAEALLIVVALLRRKGRDPRVIIYGVLVLSIVLVGNDLVAIGGQVVGWYMTLLSKAKNSDKSVTLLSLFSQGGRALWIAYWWRLAAGVFGLAASVYERRRK